MNMAQLQLPEGADRVLTRAQQAMLTRKNTKMMVYGLPNTVKSGDVENLVHAATRVYQELEATEDCFMAPAPQAIQLAGTTVQEILDVHIAFLDNSIPCGERERSKDERIYPFAFIVIESHEWRRHGATVVVLENDLDSDDDSNDMPSDVSWSVDECETSLVALGGICRGLVMEEDYWPDIRENQGRPTVRTGHPAYISTRSRSWSPPSITEEMRKWGAG